MAVHRVTWRYRTWTAEDQMQFDSAGGSTFGHSGASRARALGRALLGGVAILGAIGGGWLTEAQMESMVVLGANITEGDVWLKRPLPRAAAWALLSVLGHVPAGLVGLGPEPESRGYMLDFFRWKGPRPSWQTKDGHDYWAGIHRATTPLLTFAAANDEMDPVPGCRFMLTHTEPTTRSGFSWASSKASAKTTVTWK